MILTRKDLQSGYLDPKWYWNTKYGRVWKCLCRCGKPCYIKELALLERMVMDCGCDSYKTENKNMLQTGITYDPFWSMLEKKNISQYKLIKTHHISSGQLNRLSKDSYVSTHTIERLCQILDCDVSDIMEYRSNY